MPVTYLECSVSAVAPVRRRRYESPVSHKGIDLVRAPVLVLLAALLLVIALVVSGCSEAAADWIGFLFHSANQVIEPDDLPLVTRPLFRCARPNFINASHCRHLEQKILNATVRMTIQTWTLAADEKGYDVEVTGGHATVKDGQDLVTHNHFSIPLFAGRGLSVPGSSSMVFLYDTHGALLAEAPLSDFEIIREGAEIVIFTHEEDRFFEKLGLASAAFKDWGSLPIKEGTEVAQVDWDGKISRVDWTTVQAVQETEGVPVLVLDDGVLLGASGGGIFWNGYHVANTWRFEEQLDATGDLINSISVVALNSALVVH